MRITIIILFTIVCLSCRNDKSIRQLSIRTSVNDSLNKVADSLGIENLLNDAKWRLYCIYCDKKLKLDNTPDTLIELGTLPLNFELLGIRGDTIDIWLYFYFLGKPCVWPHVKEGFSEGCGYLNSSDSMIYYIESCGLHVNTECYDPKCPLRTVNPLQPEVISYINQNKTKINPWFLNEALKRRVIK